MAVSYMRRPMFYNGFFVHEIPIVPTWHANPWTNGRYIVIGDHKYNVIVYIALAERHYSGPLVPRTTQDGAELVMVSRTARIPRVRNKAILFLPDGTVRTCEIAMGTAKAVDEKLRPAGADVLAEFEGLCTNHRGRGGN